MKTQCHTNIQYANHIISNLTDLGVLTFCIGSGSRSAPLAHALKNNPLAKTVLHYDERCLGFYALGVAKSKSAPVCIITTSGSAVSNLFPAVMEAYMSGVPLIILTCDRPFEDNDRGMNQTCNQENIFGNYTAYSKTLPPPPHTFDARAISSSLSFIYGKAKAAMLPVHLNIPFREPLIDSSPQEWETTKCITKYLPTESILADEGVQHVIDLLSAFDKGIIVAGGTNNTKDVQEIISLAEKIGYPILADPLSGIRETGSSSHVITHYNQIIHHTKKMDALKPDVILFLGDHIISKSILVWAKSLKETKQIVVTDAERHIDPTLHIDICIKVGAQQFAIALNKNIKRKEPSSFLSQWKTLSLIAEKSIEDFFEEQDKIFEPQAIVGLLPLLKSTPLSLFIGNSLPVRYADNFLFPKKISRRIYGSRGVSGIDGNIATALGICDDQNAPLIAVIGDCTFLHDVGALHLMSTRKIPLIIVVINNNGGGIFHFLPYSGDKQFINSHISPPTELNIGNIASSFNIPFWKTEAPSDFTKMIEHLLAENTGGIIEIPARKEETLKIHEELEAYTRKQIDKSIKKERTSYFSFQKRKQAAPTSFASMDS